MKVDKKEVGKRIERIRRSSGKNMREFGELINSHLKLPLDTSPSDSIVSRWEKGKSIPNNERLKAIAEIGNITVDELLYGQQANFNKYQMRLLEEMKLNLAPKNLIINSVSLIESEEVMNRLSGEEVCEVIEEYAKWWRNDK